MTESQIKQFAVQSEELKRRCDELSKLNASIAQTIVSNRIVFERFNGLMEIVEFEISDYELKSVHFELDGCCLLETVQKYVIKYLELKNGIH